MKLNIFSKVLFRVPQFPQNIILAEAWPELKRSIKDASSYFYNLIKDLEYEDIDNQPQQVRFTIDKYFNRSRFRATPYGTFAGIGIGELGTGQHSSITIGKNRKEHRFVDWKETIQVQQIWKGLPLNQLLLQTNDSYYRFKDTFRYLYKNEERFELSEMPYYPEIETILLCCRQSTPFPSLLQQIDMLGLNQDELLEIVTELIESQLLFTNYHPNIIGADYFEKIGRGKPTAEQEQYTICYHDTLDGTLNKNDFEQLRETIKFLHAHFNDNERNSDLTTFKAQFRAKYDLEAIPIMQALDPVLGIGYGNRELDAGTSDIISKIVSQKGTGSSPDKSNNLKEYLLQQLTSNQKSNIDLSDFISKTEKDNLPLPNTLSALVSKASQHLVVDQIGGATATSLLGRFSLVGSEVHTLCTDLANVEKEANPDVVFFDIAYMGEPSVDNVNRRLQIYEYNIAICCWNDQESKIRLDDIYILFRGNELMLHSKSLNKRLIPRLSSAYNFTRSDLSLFRLFCDIQTQGIISNLIPNLQEIIPNAVHYPRLMFNNVILARESWRIHFKPEWEREDNFKNYLESKGLSRYIKAGYADQTVMLDLENQNDRNLLCSILKARKELLVSEVLPDAIAAVKDSEGNNYASEFILSLFHKQEIYKNVQVNYDRTDTPRNFPPGSEWIYFNLYCNTSITNEILVRYIEPALKALRNDLACWFFIRYNEGGDHIRLRMKPKAPLYQRVFEEMSALFSQLMDMGLLQDIQLATYKRELERYGHAGITEVEAHFSVDSRYALWLINKHYSDVQLYRIIAQGMMKVGKELFSPQELKSIIKASLSAFQKEHTTNSAIYKELNQTFRNSVDMATIQDLSLSHSFISVISKVDGDRQVTLYTDLFHMHINRIFPQHQRVHEYIIYEYLTIAMKQPNTIPMFFS